jgi:hypothetical protein
LESRTDDAKLRSKRSPAIIALLVDACKRNSKHVTFYFVAVSVYLRIIDSIIVRIRFSIRFRNPWDIPESEWQTKVVSVEMESGRMSSAVRPWYLHQVRLHEVQQ